MDPYTLMHLKGIVALWLTNGHEPVEAGNDPRYAFYPAFGWTEAASATQDLIDSDLVKYAHEVGDDLLVIPTAKGIFEALR